MVSGLEDAVRAVKTTDVKTPLLLRSNVFTIPLDKEDILTNILSSLIIVFEFSDAGVVKYEDVAPIMFIKDYFVGLTPDKSVKYLLIDEMQDYSPIHFLLFNKIYKCPKTILGDIYQCFDRDLGDDYLQTLKNIYGTKSAFYSKKAWTLQQP